MPPVSAIPRPEPVFLGFLFKRIVRRPPGWCVHEDSGLLAPAVEMICSVSGCMSPEPESKYERWGFNGAGCFDRDDPALASVLPQLAGEFTRVALDLFPLLFQGDGVRPVTTAEIFAVDPADPPAFPARASLPERYGFLGYHVASCSVAVPKVRGSAGRLAAFDCSPLSCNGEAARFPANRYCLLDAWGDALAAAGAFASEEPEPGPYVILGVHGADPIIAHGPRSTTPTC